MREFRYWGLKIKLSKQETETENLGEKLKESIFLVQIYVLGNNSKITQDLSSIIKIQSGKNKFISNTLFGSKNSQKLKTRHLMAENIFTPLFRKSFGSYLNSKELALMIHPSKVERGIFRPNKSVILESSPEFLEPRFNNLLIGSSHLKTGEKRDVYLPVENLRRHLYILGSTGSGKSTVLIRTALSACKDKTKALIFFDPHEVDLQMIVGRLPDLSNVVYFKIDSKLNEERKIAFNPLFSFRTSDIEKDALAEDILNILEQEAKDGDLGTSIKKLLKLVISTGIHFADAYYKYLTEDLKIEPEKAEQIIKQKQITIPDLPYLIRKNYKYRETIEKIFLNYGDKNISYKWQYEINDYLINPNIETLSLD